MAFKITMKGDPSALKAYSYECGYCGHEWGALARESEQEQECPECSKLAIPSPSSPGIAAYSIQDKSGRAEILRKRSEEHSKKLRKSEGWD